MLFWKSSSPAGKRKVLPLPPPPPAVSDPDRQAAALYAMCAGHRDVNAVSTVNALAERAEESRAGTGPTSNLTSPAHYLIDFYQGHGGRTPAGVEVTPDSALSLSAVFACVRNIAEDVAKLPFVAYRRLPTGGKQAIDDHPLADRMRGTANPEMVGFQMREAITACAALFGNGYGEIVRSGSGAAAEVWPIQPWRVDVRRDRADKLWYIVDGRDVIDPANMFHLRGFGIDGVMGMALTGHGRDSLGLSIAAQRYAARFFGNGVRTSGVLSHPKVLSDAAFERLRKSFDDQHSGPENAHKPKILEEGMTWTQTSAPADEAQLLESRQFAVADVARWFRMPPHKIGHLAQAAGWSTLEQQNTDYVTDTLMPWLCKWEGEAAAKLLSPLDRQTGVFGEFLVNGLLRGDSAARAAFYTSMFNIGVYSINDIRAKENDNPVEGGDTHYVNAALVPIGTVPAPAPAADPLADDADPPPTPLPDPAPAAAGEDDAAGGDDATGGA